jgi:hypothetical protein
MGGGPKLAVLFRGRIIMGGQLRRKFCLQGRAFLGWTARNRLDRKASGFTALLEIPPNRCKRDLKSRSNLGLAMPLIHCA